MTTKKQHYYPRCLLKHFANEKGKVQAYIRQANTITEMKYEKICATNYAYESDEAVDNILEGKLGNYESKLGPIIEYIIENITSNDLSISERQQKILYEYMWLQYLRTDAGRINFITMHENIFSYKPRVFPIELDEINDNKEKIIKFNRLFKQDGVLEKLLKIFKKPDNMNFHIALSEGNLLTSDNPIIGTDEWKQMILPISPNICIEFQEDSINSSNNLLVILEPEKTQYLNEATINTANYYIISYEPFTFIQNNYIYNRFNNHNWKLHKPHFNSY